MKVKKFYFDVISFNLDLLAKYKILFKSGPFRPFRQFINNRMSSYPSLRKANSIVLLISSNEMSNKEKQLYDYNDYLTITC